MVDVFVPKTPLKAAPTDVSRKRPVMVRFHGGGLMCGARDFEGWLPPWFPQYALKHDAIFVCPDYRLLPEANGVEILEDLDDFWTWVRTDLPGVVGAMDEGEGMRTTVDLTKVLSTGESAGGYLAIQSGLSHPSFIKAVIAAYPTLGLRHHPFWTSRYEKTIMGAPQYPISVLDKHLAATAPGAVVSAAMTPERLELAMAIVQHGRYGEFLERDIPNGPAQSNIFPEERVKASQLPPAFIYHGAEDSAAPVECTEQFSNLAQEQQNEVQFFKLPGDHCFDGAVELINIDEPGQEWLKKGLSFITAAWLN